MSEEDKVFEKKRAALTKALASKEGVTEIAIKNVYGPHAMSIIGEYVEAKPLKKGLPKTKRAPAERYELIESAVLPTRDEYRNALNRKFTYTASSLATDAYAAIEELAGEAREVADNMESGNLGQTQRCQTFQETADVLEGIEAPELPSVFEEIEIVRLPCLSHRTGRSYRLGEAVSDLSMVADEVESWLDEKRDEAKTGGDDETIDLSEVETTMDQLREDAGNAENVEFPDMFGG